MSDEQDKSVYAAAEAARGEPEPAPSPTPGIVDRGSFGFAPFELRADSIGWMRNKVFLLILPGQRWGVSMDVKTAERLGVELLQATGAYRFEHARVAAKVKAENEAALGELQYADMTTEEIIARGLGPDAEDVDAAANAPAITWEEAAAKLEKALEEGLDFEIVEATPEPKRGPPPIPTDEGE